MGHITLIEKGTKVFIYGVKFYEEEVLTSEFDLVLGVDILKSDDDYVDYNGTLVVEESEVENAIYEYMSRKYPMVHDYMFDIDD